MKTITIIILVLFQFSTVFSQEQENKWENIKFDVFTEYRITPVYLDGDLGLLTGNDILKPTFYAQDEQLSGTAMGFEIGYWFQKIDLTLIFSQSFRYDHIYFDNNMFDVSKNSAIQSVNDFITDYHFIIAKSFRFKNAHIFNFRVGYSYMNRGTAFAYTEQTGEFEGQPIYTTSHTDFHISAFNAGVGYKKQRWGLTLGSYITDKHKFNQPSQLLIPYIKLGYEIF